MSSADVCAAVGLEGAKVRLQFKLAHVGWECDSDGWVVELAGKRHLILTNHGSPYIAKAESLREQLKSYAELIVETLEAQQLLDEVPRRAKKKGGSGGKD